MTKTFGSSDQLTAVLILSLDFELVSVIMRLESDISVNEFMRAVTDILSCT